jgi:hypothetical protein
MQQHGFARNSTWKIVSTVRRPTPCPFVLYFFRHIAIVLSLGAGTQSADVNPDYPEPAVLLELGDNDYTRAMWCE